MFKLKEIKLSPDYCKITKSGIEHPEGVMDDLLELMEHDGVRKHEELIAQIESEIVTGFLTTEEE